MKTNAQYDNPRVIGGHGANPNKGTVRWAADKSIWLTGMILGWLIGGTYYFSWGAVLAFLVLCAITLCAGHSLGMHRKLIHESYQCPQWWTKLTVYLGTLVGLGGPFEMMRTHDLRDWAQRQPACHPFFSHDSTILRDAWWQLHCRLHLDNPPQFQFPAHLTASWFFTVLERTAMLQQLPLALALYAVGGWGWVAWGICGRVSISIMGHWLIGYFAHNSGGKDWIVETAAVQGHNVRFCGLITFGECWHNNHHAFPGAAKLGLYANQSDPGWWVLKTLEKIGIVTDLVLPEDLAPRKELASVGRPLRR